MSPSTDKKPSIIVFSRSSNQPALIEPMHQGLLSAVDIDYHLVSASDKLVSLVAGSNRVVLFVNCLMKEDIADLYNILPEFTARLAEGTLRILVLNSIGHPRLGSLLRSRATVEIIEIPVTLRAVQYKLKSGIVVVHHAHQRLVAVKSKSERELELERNPDLARAARLRAKTEGQGVLWQSAVDFDSDYWFIPGRKSIRNVVGVWLIDVLGPGPVIGTWEELPGVERSGEKAWAWRPRSVAEEIFQTIGGRWVFFGKQPEFSWQKNLWSFVSKQPMFAFYREGESAPTYMRFEFRPEEGLLILENSAFTKGLLSRIQTTFESRLGARTNVSAESRKQSVEGNFDGWDFNLDPLPGGGTRLESAADPAREIDWNDHTGSRGVNFKTGDVRMDAEKPTSKFRNALTPDVEVGGRLGLVALAATGVVAGGEAFDRLEVRVDILRRGESPVLASPEILLYEIGKSGAMLLIRDRSYKLAEKLLLRFGLDSGELKMECSMEWELTSIDLDLEDGMLVTGTFRGGDYAPLLSLVDRLETRKKELKNFYSAARG